MSQINISNLTFYYDGSYDNIFEKVSFRIDTDWKLGFIARNGRGKTTFLNLLQGKLEYKGSISSSVEFDYFPYEVSDQTKNTLDVIDEIYPGYEFWKICRELSLLCVETDVLYRPFCTLSNGERTKVMLALLFTKENHFLLIDEPTNHLDMETRQIVSEYLNRKKGFILVSHDRDFLDRCIDHVLSINKTNIEIQQGNFSSWWENKKRQDEFEEAENERLKKDIRRLNEAAGQAHKWADQVESTKIGEKSRVYEGNIDARAYIGEKSRRMQMRRKNLEKRKNIEIEEKSSLLKNLETVADLKLFPLNHYKDLLVRMENVGIFYGIPDTSSFKAVIEHFELHIKNGEKTVLEGQNGCGKTSVIKAILRQAILRQAILQQAGCREESVQQGGEFSVTGQLECAGGLILSYVPQDTSNLLGSLTNYAEKYEIDETLFKTLLRKLDFTRTQFDKNMEEYSGGQKKKVLIARSLCERAHLYIWDEPLNFIDVFSRMQIEELINKYNPTLLMVEHDKTFVNKIGAKVISLPI